MKNINHFILFFAFISIFSSCRKDEVYKVSPKYFVGEWEWSYSTGTNSTDSLRPNSELADFTAKIKINEKGDVFLYKNDVLFTKIWRTNLYYHEESPYITYIYQAKDTYPSTAIKTLQLRLKTNNTIAVSGFPMTTSNMNSQEIHIINQHKDSVKYLGNTFVKVN